MHIPVLVDFWSHATDPGQTLHEVWNALVQDYTKIAEITDTTIRQTLDQGATLTYLKDEINHKIILRYNHP